MSSFGFKATKSLQVFPLSEQQQDEPEQQDFVGEELPETGRLIEEEIVPPPISLSLSLCLSLSQYWFCIILTKGWIIFHL